jgi:hypothetical protein
MTEVLPRHVMTASVVEDVMTAVHSVMISEVHL